MHACTIHYRYKIPRFIAIVGDVPGDAPHDGSFATDFPMTLSGKVQKYRLRNMVKAALGELYGSVVADATEEALPRLVLQDRFPPKK